MSSNIHLVIPDLFLPQQFAASACIALNSPRSRSADFQISLVRLSSLGLLSERAICDVFSCMVQRGSIINNLTPAYINAAAETPKRAAIMIIAGMTRSYTAR
ncbi:MAG: hypothetical protein ABL858_00865 [Candidatus Nitrotoga sp.]